MKNFPPNINPQISTLIAIIIAYALQDDFTALEQIAIANWFIQLGQTMATTASFQRVIEERISSDAININSRQFKCGGSPYVNPKSDPNLKEFYKDLHGISDMDLSYIQEAIKRINEEIEKIKRKGK